MAYYGAVLVAGPAPHREQLVCVMKEGCGSLHFSCIHAERWVDGASTALHNNLATRRRPPRRFQAFARQRRPATVSLRAQTFRSGHLSNPQEPPNPRNVEL